MNIKVSNSQIQGQGVFACEDIEEGHWQYVYGKLTILTPGDPMERYVIEFDEAQVYMPYAPFCYLNHSNDPNCEIADCDNDSLNSIMTIEALRDIKLFEELTINYGDDWERM